MLYKWRFVPLAVTGSLLAVVAVVKYAAGVEVGSALGWAVALTVASFIWLQAMREHARDRKAAEERAAAPPPTGEEIRERQRSEIEAGIEQQRTNIAFRSIYLFFSVMIFLGGATLICANREYTFGGIMLASGVFFVVHSVMTLRRWIGLLRALKEAKGKTWE